RLRRRLGRTAPGRCRRSGGGTPPRTAPGETACAPSEAGPEPTNPEAGRSAAQRTGGSGRSPAPSGLLARSREALDGGHQLGDLLVGLGAATGERIADAVVGVVGEQAQRHAV